MEAAPGACEGEIGGPVAVRINGWSPTDELATAERAAVPRTVRLLPYGLWALLTAIYSTLSLTRFARLSTPSFDNAIFQQAIAGYAHLRAPIVDLKGPGYNILGDHFSPVLALLAPLYRILPFAQTLLVAQAVLVSACVVPIGRVAIARLGTGAGLAVTGACGLSFGVQLAVYTDFHEVAFAAPLLAFAGEAYLHRRWRAVAAWTLPLLLVKEDLGVTVATVGLVLVLVGARRIGLLLAVAGVGAFLVVVFGVIPSFNAGGTFAYWGAVSFAPGGPGALQTFFTGWDLKGPTLLLTFGITGFLSLRSPWVLLAVPTLAWRWIGTNSQYWDTNWHYSLLLMPILFIALIDAIDLIGAGSPAWLHRYAGHVPTLAVGMALVLCLQFPLHNLWQDDNYRTPDRAEAAAAAMAMMPAGASVETNLGLVTHLAGRFDVYWFDTIGTSVTPRYVLFDRMTALPPGDIVGYAEHQHPGARYRQIFDRDGYVLVQRS